jgi:hypothetical protein
MLNQSSKVYTDEEDNLRLLVLNWWGGEETTKGYIISKECQRELEKVNQNN